MAVQIVLTGDAAYVAYGLVATLVESKMGVLPGDVPHLGRRAGPETDPSVAIIAEGRVESISALVQHWLESVGLADDRARVEEVAARDVRVNALLRLADLDWEYGDPGAARDKYEHILREVDGADGTFGTLPVEALTLGVVLERVATVSLLDGKLKDARSYIQRGIQVVSHLLSRTVDENGLEVYASLLIGLAHVSSRASDSGTARRCFEQMIELVAGVQLQGSNQWRVRAVLGLVEYASQLSPFADAVEHLSRVAQLARRIADEAPDDIEAQLVWPQTTATLGDVELVRGRVSQAKHWYGLSLAAYEELARSRTSDIGIRRGFAAALARYGDALLEDEKVEQAGLLYHRSAEIRSQVADQLPSDAEALRDLGLAYERLGALPGARDQGVTHLRKAVDIYRRLVQAQPTAEPPKETLAVALFGLGRVLMGVDHGGLDGVRTLAESHAILSDLRSRGVKLNPQAKRVLAILDPQYGGSGKYTHKVRPDDRAVYAEVNVLGQLSDQSLARREYDAAENMLVRALTLARTIEHPPSVARVMGNLGRVAVKRGDFAAAIPRLDASAKYARSHELHVEECQSLLLVSEAFKGLGDGPAAAGAAMLSVDAARRSDDPLVLGRALGIAVERHIEIDVYEPMLPLIAEAIELFGFIGARDELAASYLYLGEIYRVLGQFDASADAFLKHIELGNPPELSVQVHVGLILAKANRLEEAIEQATLALNLHRGDPGR